MCHSKWGLDDFVSFPALDGAVFCILQICAFSSVLMLMKIFFIFLFKLFSFAMGNRSKLFFLLVHWLYRIGIL